MMFDPGCVNIIMVDTSIQFNTAHIYELEGYLSANFRSSPLDQWNDMTELKPGDFYVIPLNVSPRHNSIAEFSGTLSSIKSDVDKLVKYKYKIFLFEKVNQYSHGLIRTASWSVTDMSSGEIDFKNGIIMNLGHFDYKRFRRSVRIGRALKK